MLLDEKEIRSRMESPMNLLNRLRSITNPHKNTNLIPTLPPTSDELIENLDDKIANTSTRSKATSLLNSAMTELEKRLPEVTKPEKLAAIAADMSKIVDRTTPVHNHDEVRAPQIIIYAPQIVSEDNFNVIDVGDT
jgi:hypothetical protein